MSSTPPELRGPSWVRYVAAVVVSVVGLAGVGLGYVSDLSEHRARIRADERSVALFRDLHQVSVRLQEVRGRHYLGLLRPGALRDRVEQAGARLEEALLAVERRHGSDQRLARILAATRARHRELHRQLVGDPAIAPRTPASAAFLAYSELIDDYRVSVESYRRERALFVDPESGSLAFGTLAVVALPHLIDQLGRVRAFGSGVALVTADETPSVGTSSGVAAASVPTDSPSPPARAAGVEPRFDRQTASARSLVTSAWVKAAIDSDLDHIESMLLRSMPTGDAVESALAVTPIRAALRVYEAQLEEPVSGDPMALAEARFAAGTQLIGLVEQLQGRVFDALSARLAARSRDVGAWRVVAGAAIVVSIGILLFFVIDFAWIVRRFVVVQATGRATLSDANERYEAILENMVDGVIVIDRRGIVQSINAAAQHLFGYRADEVVGQNVSVLMPEPFRGEHDGYLERYHGTGEKRIIGIGREVLGLRKSGETFPFELAVAQVGEGDARFYCGTVHDLTEQKRVDRMKNEFVSTVSHELRTPLTSIRGSLGLLLGGAVGEVPVKVREMLTIASNNTARLLHLINDILDMQKIESGQLVFRFRRLELAPFLEQAVRDNAAYAQQHGVEIAVVQTIDDAYVYADRERLMQVVANLLSNAAKFSKKGGQIELSAVRTVAGGVRISVSDHGAGIDDAFRPKVFERFAQGDASDAGHRGGTGLGLSITRAIVEKHGGRIDFVSRRGLGTTFFVELPEIGADAMVADESASLPRTVDRLSSDGRVLIVEDDADVATILERLLATAGFDADVAVSAEQAWTMLGAHPRRYRIITLDVRLPGQDGLSFLRAMREDPATSEIPVIVISVAADDARRELNGGALWVVDWLSKPIEEHRLLKAVQRAATQGRSARVLHVEDEDDIHTIVATMLGDECDLERATTLAAAKEALSRREFDLVLLDIGLPDGSGLDLLDVIEGRMQQPRVVIFSAQDVAGDYAERVEAVLSKSHTNNERLLETIRAAFGRV